MRLRGESYIIWKTKILIVSLFLLSLTVFPAVTFAQSEEERNFLLMFFNEEDLVVVSPTRSPKPIAQVAENITVITSEQIELMNAHTLGEVLNTVPGIQAFMTGGPGSSVPVHIQGAEQRHTAVFIDGVDMANISSNIVDTGSIPVQHIERIEIIKGPASSAWGSSIGGVVNIITKSGEGRKKVIGGTLSATYGEENTGDFRAEISGKKADIGYYLFAGKLQSDGFRANNDVSNKHFYSKLTYGITKDTSVIFTLGYDRGDRGETELSSGPVSVSSDNTFSTLFSTFSLRHVISSKADVLLSLRTSRLVFERSSRYGAPFSTTQESKFKDSGYGAGMKFTWKPDGHTIVVGSDFDNRTLKSDTIAKGEQDLEKWAVFVNDTTVWGKLSITPGIRYDFTNTNGDFTSPSLGLTYTLNPKTLLRAYIARGFHIPAFDKTFVDIFGFDPNPDLNVEKVWSYQGGVETSPFDHLWLKFSLFMHDIKDVVTQVGSTFGNKGKQRRQGMEIEVKTVPVYNTSLSAGATFIRAKDLDDETVLRNTPRYTYDIGLTYDDHKSLRALLKGRYIWWNADSSKGGRYDAFIFDFSISKIILKGNDHTFEIIAAAHNIFNGAQHLAGTSKNPGRWIEGGIRYTF